MGGRERRHNQTENGLGAPLYFSYECEDYDLHEKMAIVGAV